MTKRKQKDPIMPDARPGGLPQRTFFIAVIALLFLFQTTTFFAPHNEGDEVAYLALSHEMHWDFSNYTVKDVDPVNTFPNKLYRAPIFLHPPVFPLLLKIGWALGNPIVFGLLANALTKAILVLLLYLLCKRIDLPEFGCLLAAVYILVDPIIAFISTRLLTDILFTTGLVATLYFQISALKRGSLWILAFSSLAFSLALNAKFQGIVFLPLFALTSLYSAYVVLLNKPEERKRILSVGCSWCAILMIFGLSHHMRLFFAYGFSGVHDLIYTVEKPLGPFIQRMSARSFGKMLIYLAILQPWVVVFFAPTSVKTILHEFKSRPEIQLILSFVIYSILAIWLSAFQQERYWAPVFPLLFIIAIVATKSECGSLVRFFQSWKGIVMTGSLLLLLLNNFMTNVITPGAVTATVYPVLFQIFPFLTMPSTPFDGF